MYEWTMTVTCDEPPVYERVKVKAEDMDTAWDKAKQKARRKYGGKIADYHICGVERKEC